MVSSLLVEALSSPTDALLELYNAQSTETHNDFPVVVAKHFSDVFKAEDAFREVDCHISPTGLYFVEKLSIIASDTTARYQSPA